MFSCEFCKIFKNTVFYRTLPVAASERFIVVWNVNLNSAKYHEPLNRSWTVKVISGRIY